MNDLEKYLNEEEFNWVVENCSKEEIKSCLYDLKEAQQVRIIPKPRNFICTVLKVRLNWFVLKKV